MTPPKHISEILMVCMLDSANTLQTILCWGVGREWGAESLRVRSVGVRARSFSGLLRASRAFWKAAAGLVGHDVGTTHDDLSCLLSHRRHAGLRLGTMPGASKMLCIVEGGHHATEARRRRTLTSPRLRAFTPETPNLPKLLAWPPGGWLGRGR